MKKLLMAVAVLCCASSLALAGPNAGGTLIVHSTPPTVYTFDITDYCGMSGLTACDQANTNLPNDNLYTWWVTAAFAGSPVLAGITFGVDYDAGTLFLVGWGACGDFELATGGWPAPGEGTAVTWGVAETTQLTDVYWFAGYEYYGMDTAFCLIPHPTQGANFADDDVPANLDPIAGLGCIGFNGDPGYLPCPAGAPEVCCFPDGSCEILFPDDCTASGGTVYGPGVCQPNPCPPPPEGACCMPDGTCIIVTEDQCLDAGYEYVGDDVPCDPNPCVIPTIETTWGSIKANYR